MVWQVCYFYSELFKSIRICSHNDNSSTDLVCALFHIILYVIYWSIFTVSPKWSKRQQEWIVMAHRAPEVLKLQNPVPTISGLLLTRATHFEHRTTQMDIVHFYIPTVYVSFHQHKHQETRTENLPSFTHPSLFLILTKICFEKCW